MLLFLLSPTGFPPTAGFVAKFVVILSAVRAGHMVLPVLAVACSVVSAFVYMSVVVQMRIFLGILMVGFLYARDNGALDWK